MRLQSIVRSTFYQHKLRYLESKYSRELGNRSGPVEKHASYKRSNLSKFDRFVPRELFEIPRISGPYTFSYALFSTAEQTTIS